MEVRIRKAAYHVAGWHQDRHMKWLSVELLIEKVGETGRLEPALEQNINHDDIVVSSANKQILESISHKQRSFTKIIKTMGPSIDP